MGGDDRGSSSKGGGSGAKSGSPPPPQQTAAAAGSSTPPAAVPPSSSGSKWKPVTLVAADPDARSISPDALEDIIDLASPPPPLKLPTISGSPAAQKKLPQPSLVQDAEPLTPSP